MASLELTPAPQNDAGDHQTSIANWLCALPYGSEI